MAWTTDLAWFHVRYFHILLIWSRWNHAALQVAASCFSIFNVVSKWAPMLLTGAVIDIQFIKGYRYNIQFWQGFLWTQRYIKSHPLCLWEVACIWSPEWWILTVFDKACLVTLKRSSIFVIEELIYTFKDGTLIVCRFFYILLRSRHHMNYPNSEVHVDLLVDCQPSLLQVAFRLPFLAFYFFDWVCHPWCISMDGHCLALQRGIFVPFCIIVELYDFTNVSRSS